MTSGDSSSDTTTTPSTGLLASLQRLLSTSAEVLRTRLEILSTELEEEGVRVQQLFLLEQLSLFFIGLGLLLATLFVILAFWDSHRLLVLAAFSIFYLVVGIGTALLLRRKLSRRPRLFASTLAELGKDRERLTSR
jgi:uncharacterized membrane protein YqjE